MQRIFLLFILFYFTIINASVFEKAEPLFIAEFAETYGNQHFFSTATKSISEMMPPKGTSGCIHFDNVLEIATDSMIAVIIRGNSSELLTIIDEPVQINGNLITGYLHINNVDSVLNDTFVDYLYISKPLFQSNDSARFHSNIIKMNENGYMGDNVIAAFIDDGFNLSTSIFQNIDNRIKFVWNQQNERIASPLGFLYGEELDSLNYLFYPFYDYSGHGTSVLATFASGDSYNSGMLPISGIIAVNANKDEKSIIDAIKYISDKCDYMNYSFILCLPLNHYWGKHNGNSPLDTVINYFFNKTKTGRGISVSSGNLGNQYIHFSSLITDTIDRGLLENKHIVIQCVQDFRTDINILNLHNTDFRLVSSRDGILIKSEWIDPQSEKAGFITDSNCIVKFGFNTNDNHLHIIIEQNNNLRIAIEFLSSGINDSIIGYAAQGGYFIRNSKNNNLIKGDNNNTIAMPGLASQAITAGTFVSRTHIAGISGIGDSLFQIPVWNASGNSTNIKPDVYAPGKFIFSFENNSGDALYSLENHYGVFYGSSYSAAVTAGAMAVVLGSDRFMPTIKLNRLIRTGVKYIPYQAGEENVEGYGFLDAYSSFLATRVGINMVEPEYSYTVNKNIAIKFTKPDIKFVSISKNTKPVYLINDYMALDKNPKNGNNIYQIEIIDNCGYLTKFIDTFCVNKQYYNQLETGTIMYFDISGRKLLTYPTKTGIYFLKRGEYTSKFLIMR